MKIFKVLPLAAVMLLMLVAAGCAGKDAGTTPPADDGGMSEAEIAAKQLEEAKKIIVTEKIYFAFDSSELTQEARAILQRKADVLKTFPDLRVLVEGHCDERGTEEYNLALGERRAHAAKKYLILLGVAKAQLETISYGEEQPASSGHGESAWAQNRRDEFKLVW